MRNWKFLVKLLEGRPHSVGAEVGVFEGECTLGLLEGLPNLQRMICVDLWKFDQEYWDASPNKTGKMVNARWDTVYNTFLTKVARRFKDQITVLKQPSADAAKLVYDGILDFVFIDANHSYGHVKRDIDAWLPKVKVGGIMAGDDYIDKPLYGVIEAVNERFTTFEVHTPSRVWYTVKGGSV